MSFKPNYHTTLAGSVPHDASTEVCRQIVQTLDIPAWPQMPRRDFREGIYIQFAASLPRVVLDSENEKITLDTTGDLTPDLETFYEHYLADHIDYFALPYDFAAGFYEMLQILSEFPGEWVKGQVVGPLTFGLTVVDQDLRAVFYNDLLADVIVKNIAMNARWQIRTLKVIRPNVVIFVDEPYLASWGSAYVSIDRNQAIIALNEIFDAIHAEGGIAGVHCCANTDWSILLGTNVDILNLDAYGYLGSLALYPAELRDFLERGGVVAWGIVPNDEAIDTVSPRQLATRLMDGIDSICDRAAARGMDIAPEMFDTRSLITPACGFGSGTPEIMTKALGVLLQTGEILKTRT
jgi:hypothetical protein